MKLFNKVKESLTHKDDNAALFALRLIDAATLDLPSLKANYDLAQFNLNKHGPAGREPDPKAAREEQKIIDGYNDARNDRLDTLINNFKDLAAIVEKETVKSQDKDSLSEKLQWVKETIQPAFEDKVFLQGKIVSKLNEQEFKQVCELLHEAANLPVEPDVDAHPRPK